MTKNTLVLERDEVDDLLGTGEIVIAVEQHARERDPSEHAQRREALLQRMLIEMPLMSNPEGSKTWATERCNVDGAMRLIEHAVTHARDNGGYRVPYKISVPDWNKYHQIIKHFMPDDTVAELGTVHHEMQLLCIRPDEGELSVIHSMEDGDCVMIVTIVRAPVIAEYRLVLP